MPCPLCRLHAAPVIPYHMAVSRADAAWRTGPTRLWEAPSSKSACKASVATYTAWGYAPKHIIQDPANRRQLRELQLAKRTMRASRLKQLSTTALAARVEMHMLTLSESAPSLGQSCGASTSSSRRGKRRRRRPRSAVRRQLRCVPEPGSVAALRDVLIAAQLPPHYASALAANGLGTVAELARATLQDLLDVGLQPGHARELRTVFSGWAVVPARPSPSAQPPPQPQQRRRRQGQQAGRPGSPITIAERVAAQSRMSAQTVGGGRPRSAPPRRAMAVNVVEPPEFADDYVVATPTAASPPPPRQEQVAAQITDAAADVAADMVSGVGVVGGGSSSIIGSSSSAVDVTARVLAEELAASMADLDLDEELARLRKELQEEVKRLDQATQPPR